MHLETHGNSRRATEVLHGETIRAAVEVVDGGAARINLHGSRYCCDIHPDAEADVARVAGQGPVKLRVRRQVVLRGREWRTAGFIIDEVQE